jgi:hypothetical protein
VGHWIRNERVDNASVAKNRCTPENRVKHSEVIASPLYDLSRAAELAGSAATSPYRVRKSGVEIV